MACSYSKLTFNPDKARSQTDDTFEVITQYRTFPEVKGKQTVSKHLRQERDKVRFFSSPPFVPPRGTVCSRSDMAKLVCNGRAKNWCWTLNNYTEEDCEAISAIGANYTCFGKEKAPLTGTDHLQGYISFAERKTFRQVKVSFSEEGCFFP